MIGITGAIADQPKEKWFEKFFRFGLICKGVVYCLMGLLTVLASIGLSREKGSKTEAIKMIHEQPFGQVLLIIIAIGLLGYVALRVFQSFKDIDNKGNSARGLITRAGYAISAIMYAALGVYAIKIVLNGNSSGDSRELLISKVLALPAGKWIIGISAIIILGSGIQQIHKGFSGKFMKRISISNTKFHDLFKKAGTVGYIARGIVLSIIGYFFLHAVFVSGSKEAFGTDDALNLLERNLGRLLMAVVAAGLAAYGIFMFVKAKYQKIDIRMD